MGKYGRKANLHVDYTLEKFIFPFLFSFMIQAVRIPLNEFELHVKPEPLERGLSLFEREGVDSIRNLGKGSVEAVVHEGGGVWHPRLSLRDEVVVEAECACGESPGGICRHGVALMFALQSGAFPEGIATRSGKLPKEKVAKRGRGRPGLDSGPPSPKAPRRKQPKPPKTPADLLAMVPHEALVGFILEQCKLDKEFAVRFKAHFAELLPASSPAEIKKRLQEMTRAAVTTKGKRKTLNLEQLTTRVNEWLGEGERLVAVHDYVLAFAIAELLAVELMELQRQRFSNSPDIHPLVLKAGAFMLHLGDAALPEAVRVEFLQQSLKSWEGRTSSVPPAVPLATKLCQTKAEYEAVEKIMISVLRSGNEQYLGLHLAMVLRVKGEAAAQAFRQQHAATAHFLREDIAAALSKQDFPTAVLLARKGIGKYGGYETLRAEWTDLLDTILAAQGDVEGRIALAITCFQQHYATARVSLALIATIAGKERWVAERSLLADSFAVKQYPDMARLNYLFELDGDWEGMLTYIKRYQLGRATLLGQALTTKMPERYAETLKELIEEALVTKTRFTEVDLRGAMAQMMGCVGKDPVVHYFRALVNRFTNSHVLANFVRHLDRHVANSYYTYWY